MTRAGSVALACRALACCALALPSCGGAPATGAERSPQPAMQTPAQTPADALASRIVEASGGAHLRDVAELRFTFVVVADGTERARVVHAWDLRGERDRVRWTTDDGHHVDAVVDLDTRTARATLDGAPVTGDALAPLAEEAYSRWVNDSYWLMMPLKLLDPGVHRTLEAPRERDGQTYQILSLTFDHVGLTPGDHYWLFVDPDTARVVRWEMVLEGQTTPPRGLSWTDYRPVGPLVLAHDHASDDGTKHVQFTDTAALPALAPHDFDLSAP